MARGFKSAVALVGGLTVSAGVYAQAAAPAGDATEQVTLEQVIVSAQRRVESAQDVPIAISAFSAEQLQSAGAIVLELRILGQDRVGRGIPLPDLRQCALALNLFEPEIGIFRGGLRDGDGGDE